MSLHATAGLGVGRAVGGGTQQLCRPRGLGVCAGAVTVPLATAAHCWHQKGTRFCATVRFAYDHVLCVPLRLSNLPVTSTDHVIAIDACTHAPPHTHMRTQAPAFAQTAPHSTASKCARRCSHKPWHHWTVRSAHGAAAAAAATAGAPTCVVLCTEIWAQHITDPHTVLACAPVPCTIAMLLQSSACSVGMPSLSSVFHRCWGG